MTDSKMMSVALIKAMIVMPNKYDSNFVSGLCVQTVEDLRHTALKLAEIVEAAKYEIAENKILDTTYFARLIGELPPDFFDK